MGRRYKSDGVAITNVLSRAQDSLQDAYHAFEQACQHPDAGIHQRQLQHLQNESQKLLSAAGDALERIEALPRRR